MGNSVGRNNAITQRAKLRRAFLYQGIFSRVARNLRLGKSGRAHVWRVAAGQRQSQRVIDGLISEIDRIERTARKEAA